MSIIHDKSDTFHLVFDLKEDGMILIDLHVINISGGDVT